MTNIWELFDNNTDLEEFEQGVKSTYHIGKLIIGT